MMVTRTAADQVALAAAYLRAAGAAAAPCRVLVGAEALGLARTDCGLPAVCGVRLAAPAGGYNMDLPALTYALSIPVETRAQMTGGGGGEGGQHDSVGMACRCLAVGYGAGLYSVRLRCPPQPPNQHTSLLEPLLIHLSTPRFLF